ncbi:MAG: hypothetical protein PUE12_18400 [Oscillospiraceae bacterium]|nr:hypothetical protein [Oscillospiraceae bacterium]
MNDALNTTEIKLYGYLDIFDNDTQIEFISDGKTVSLSELLKEFNSDLITLTVTRTVNIR